MRISQIHRSWSNKTCWVYLKILHEELRKKDELSQRYLSQTEFQEEKADNMKEVLLADFEAREQIPKTTPVTEKLLQWHNTLNKKKTDHITNISTNQKHCAIFYISCFNQKSIRETRHN